MPQAFPALYLTDEMRALEARAFADDPRPSLMERAGNAAGERACALAGEGRGVLVLVGPGNNGGDALEVAAHLKRLFYRVDVVFLGDSERLSTDAQSALAKWKAADGRLLQAIPADTRYDLVVDGLFGIGLERPIAGRYAELIAQANALPGRKLALDVPSGINADTGAVMGVAFRATHTITFIARKPGLYTLDGPDHCGEVSTAPIGLDAETLQPPQGRLVDSALLAAPLVARPRNFHKGRAGSVVIIGGATGMVGAALLAGRAAIRLGAGKVFLGLLADSPPQVDIQQPELMLRDPDGLLRQQLATAVAVGPGMGSDANAQRLLAQSLAVQVDLVVDADALNMIAAHAVLQSALADRKAATLLTPHPAEAARLLGVDASAVQANRVNAACTLAGRFRCWTALKGNGTVIAAPDGRWWINTSGNPGMASAGMGDVLTGMIASLLAQGLETGPALLAGVYLHGAAADGAAAQGCGPIGLTAGELVDVARALL
ncbi:MAG: NAD(P)H-hydrate dehydratase, partial [Betaproteobacteria bacterium]|nr:NAD(P)H-hydrate dehydratase [Betaproteobacteria bacterium]